MSCSSCNKSVSRGVCGCGTSCKPYPVCIKGFHCAPPPMPPPCGYRPECAADGTVLNVPVWHSVHALIPMAMGQCSGMVSEMVGCGEITPAIEQQLACYLISGEQNTSTCGFPGDRYFRGVLLYAQAEQELRADHDLWLSERKAALSQGFNFTRKAPTLQEQPSWQLRESLKVRRHVVFSNAG